LLQRVLNTNVQHCLQREHAEDQRAAIEEPAVISQDLPCLRALPDPHGQTEDI